MNPFVKRTLCFVKAIELFKYINVYIVKLIDQNHHAMINVMNKLKLRKSEDNDTPQVNFNPDTGIMELEGNSFMETPSGFYGKLYGWLVQYFNEVQKPIVFNFKIQYFNSSSSKKLIELLAMLKDYELNGGSVTANWYFAEEDEDLEEELEDFVIETGLPLNFHSFSTT